MKNDYEKVNDLEKNMKSVDKYLQRMKKAKEEQERKTKVLNK